MQKTNLRLWTILGALALGWPAIGCSDGGDEGDGDGDGDSSSSSGDGDASTTTDEGTTSTSGDSGDATAEQFVDDKAIEIAAAITDKMGDESPSDKTIVYNLVWDAPFFQTIRQGFQVAAQEIGFDAQIITMEDGWPPTGSLMDFDAEGVDAYVSHWAGGVFEDHPDLPWVAIEPGTDVTPDKFVAGISSNNDALGGLLSDLMLDALEVDSGKVAVYGAPDGPGFARGEAITQLLEDAGYEVVGAPTSDVADDAEKAYAQLSVDFEEHTDIVGIVGTLGFHGAAIGNWLVENEYDAGAVKVVCTDFETEVQDLISKKYISATAVQRQYWWGYMAAYIAYGATILSEDELSGLLKDFDDENKIIGTDFDAVTPENQSDYLDFLHELGVIE